MRALLAVVFIVFFTVVSCATAADKPADTQKTATKSARKITVKQLTGEIVAIDATARAMTVKGRMSDVTFVGEEKMFSGIGLGDRVTVKYVEQEGKNVLKSVAPAKNKGKQKGKAP